MKRVLLSILTTGLIYYSGCDRPKIIDVDPNFFLNRETVEIMKIESIKDTLDNKEVYLRPNPNLGEVINKEYPNLRGIEIKILRENGFGTPSITYSGKDVYSIEELILEK